MKIRYPHFMFILCLSISFFSCDSENAGDCFKKTGDVINREFSLEPFHSIVVIDEADVYLENGNDQRVMVKAGKNLIPDIHFDVKDSILTITNNNRCNWVRTPGNPGIYIQNDRLRKIEIYDYVNFYSPDSLRLNILKIYSDGTGNFDLKLDVDSLQIESIYISNFKLAGRVDFLEIRFTDDSQFDGKELISEYNAIHHGGSNLIELFPIKELTGELTSTGSLCYFHTPEILDVEISHTGQLINCSD
jgi:hypothetical protein